MSLFHNGKRGFGSKIMMVVIYQKHNVEKIYEGQGYGIF